MPIINPWIIYIIGVVDVLKISLPPVSCLLILVGAFTRALQGVDSDLDWVNTKLMMISGLIMFVLFILLPSSSTITKMVVAQNITIERIDKGTEIVEKVYNDIMKIMEKK